MKVPGSTSPYTGKAETFLKIALEAEEVGDMTLAEAALDLAVTFERRLALDNVLVGYEEG